MKQKTDNLFRALAGRLAMHKKLISIVFVTVLFAYCGIVKFSAATQLNYYSDEPDDYGNIIGDLKTIPSFFDRIASADQARLPHLVTVPITIVFGDDSLLPSRMLYIAIHLAYLVVIYKLFRLSLSKVKALYGLAMVALSAYLFSFSVFTMTTSSSLFLLLGTLMVYVYLRYVPPPGVKKIVSVNTVAILGVVSGLALASRFFAVLILVSIFMHDAYINRRLLKKNNTYRIWQLPYENLNIIFTIIFITINIVVTDPILKLIAIAGLIVYYGIYFIVEYLGHRDKRLDVGFLSKWVVIVHTAFVFTLLGSPVHLNIKNIVRIFEWSSTWHKVENYINPSRFDIFTIMGVKTGWLAGIAILCALGLIAWRRQMAVFVKTYLLFIILILIHLIVFLKVKYVIVWYPLFLMPFFYLPLAYIFPDTKKQILNPLGFCLLLVLLFIPLQEQYRYWRLYPYGHIDGAQYGKEYIGWNKPGAITFEATGQVADYFVANQQSLPPGTIDCRMTTSVKYNPWASRLLSLILADAGWYMYQCLDMPQEADSPYAITSLYIPDSELESLSQLYKKEKVFTEKGIPIATLWVKK